jgi:KDO2-lipid IV(A) lauroyltransferase
MYYLVYVPLYILSLLPWFVMYGISDFLTFLVYNVFSYRKDVVLSNLAIAFPEKTQAERNKIAKDFYRLLMDTIVETLKLISLSKKGVMKKFTGDATVINEVMDRGRNLTVLAMHNFNWEIVNHNVSMQLRYPFIGVYMPLSNKIFERLIADMRTRYGTIIIPAPKFKTSFPKYVDTHHILALVADQNPGDPNNATWVPFFGKLTPFVKGPEKGARMNGTAVLFGHFFPIRRGHYTFEWKIATYNAAELPEGELTKMYVAYVEECIRKHPANYLWSHRRWKYSK